MQISYLLKETKSEAPWMLSVLTGWSLRKRIPGLATSLRTISNPVEVSKKYITVTYPCKSNPKFAPKYSKKRRKLGVGIF